MRLKEVKTKEHHVSEDGPKTLRRIPKELARRSILSARDKGKEQLAQASQNGMGGAEQAAPEESAANQMLNNTGEWGRDAAAGSGNALRRAPTRAARRMRTSRERTTRDAGVRLGGPDGRVKEKDPSRLRAQARGEARTPRAGKPAVKAAPQSGRPAHAAAKRSAQAAKQAAQRAVQAARAAHRTARAAGRALASTAKACIAALKSLVSALAAGGGAALVIILLICFIALVAGSAFGIFFSAEPTGKGMTLQQAVQTLNAEYDQQLRQLEASVPHDRMEYTSANGSVAIQWQAVLAVFAADMAADEHGQQVVALDDAQMEQLRAVLADMHQIRHSTHTEEHKVEIAAVDTDGSETVEQVTVSETVLQIEIVHRGAAEMAAAYGFTPRQNEQLALLADPQYDALWMELLGGYVSGGGQIITPDTDWVGTDIFAWPLPQSFTITSNFGYRQDPFTGELAYHNGTDIAAPQGTPILAAAGGTVTVANGADPWGGGYGYYVKLSHSGGLETLYAHCSAIAVTAGQQVQRGEVIGYVGSTGNSTGNHLHFEVWVNEQRMDMMLWFRNLYVEQMN